MLDFHKWLLLILLYKLYKQASTYSNARIITRGHLVKQRNNGFCNCSSFHVKMSCFTVFTINFFYFSLSSGDLHVLLRMNSCDVNAFIR